MDLVTYPRQIVHVHGIYTDPNEAIALTESGYRKLYRDNRLFQQFLWLLAATKRIVFLGFGFEDTDFLNAMRDAARDVHANGTRHFAIIPVRPAEDDAPIRHRLNERYLVEPVFYELLEDGGNPFVRFPGKLVVADPSERKEWSLIGLRRLMRESKRSPNTVSKAIKGKPVRCHILLDIRQAAARIIQGEYR